jgi:hypothetical protein
MATEVRGVEGLAQTSEIPKVTVQARNAGRNCKAGHIFRVKDIMLALRIDLHRVLVNKCTIEYHAASFYSANCRDSLLDGEGTSWAAVLRSNVFFWL